MASMVMMFSWIINLSSNSGIGVILFGLLLTLTWPRTRLLSFTKALIIWSGDFSPFVFAPRKVLPSIAMTCPLPSCEIEFTHSIEQLSNWWLSVEENTLFIMYREVILFLRFKNPLRKASFESANSFICFQVSAPQTTKMVPIRRMSAKSCNWFTWLSRVFYTTENTYYPTIFMYTSNVLIVRIMYNLR